MDVEHPDIEEFLQIRSEATPSRMCRLVVCISDEWMQSMIDGIKISAFPIMAKIHKKRSETGYPYIFFTDNVNKQAPKNYQEEGLKIKHSQLCAEIMEYTDETKSFVCCLSSMNLLHFDEWKFGEQEYDPVMILTCLP